MKKILLFLILGFTSLLAETYTFWVENPDMVNAYYNVFTAMNSIFGSSDYIDVLKLFFLVGGFFVFAAAIFNGFSKNMDGVLSGYAKYILGGTALLILLFSSSSTIWIIADEPESYCTTSTNPYPAGLVIDEFPTILGAIFTTINRISTTSLDIVEKEFVTPSQTLSMKKGGYNHSVKDAMQVLNFTLSMDTNNTTNNLSFTVKSFFSQCIITPFSGKGIEGYTELVKLKSSGNIYNYLDDLYINNNPTIGGINARDYLITLNGEVWNCGELYDRIKPSLEEYKNNSTCFSNIDEGALSLIVGGAGMPPSSTFSDVALQAGLIYELEGSINNLGVDISGLGYATGKSRAEAVQTYLAQGEYMAEILPTLQMTLRAIIFAFFPFVFIMALLPGGFTILKSYFMSLIWIELWTPVAGIINMFLSSNTKEELSTIYNNSGLTLMNSIDMLSVTSTISGIAGYLYMSVPAITWAIISGSSQMLGGLGRDLAIFMQKNIQTKTMNLDQANMAKRSEVSARAGKDISMAEMMHYEAIQSGRMEGAKLGAQMNAGMDTMADIEAMKETKKTEGYKQLESATGLGAVSMGTMLAGNDTRTNLENLNTGVQALDITGNIKKTTKGAAKHKANVKTGTDIAESENTQSIDSAKHTARKKIADDVGIGKAAAKFSQRKLVQASENQTKFDILKNNAIDPSLGTNAGQNQNWDISEKATRNSFLKKNGYSPNDTGWSQYVTAAGGIGAAKAIAAIANKHHNGSLEEMGFANRADQGTIITDGGELVNIKMGTVKGKDGNTKLGKEIRNYDQLGQNFYNHQVRAIGVDILSGTHHLADHSQSALARREVVERSFGAMKELSEMNRMLGLLKGSAPSLLAGKAIAVLINRRKKQMRKLKALEDKNNKTVIRKLNKEVNDIKKELRAIDDKLSKIFREQTVEQLEQDRSEKRKKITVKLQEAEQKQRKAKEELKKISEEQASDRAKIKKLEEGEEVKLIDKKIKDTEAKLAAKKDEFFISKDDLAEIDKLEKELNDLRQQKTNAENYTKRRINKLNQKIDAGFKRKALLLKVKEELAQKNKLLDAFDTETNKQVNELKGLYQQKNIRTAKITSLLLDISDVDALNSMINGKKEFAKTTEEVNKMKNRILKSQSKSITDHIQVGSTKMNKDFNKQYDLLRDADAEIKRSLQEIDRLARINTDNLSDLEKNAIKQSIISERTKYISAEEKKKMAINNINTIFNKIKTVTRDNYKKEFESFKTENMKIKAIIDRKANIKVNDYVYSELKDIKKSLFIESEKLKKLEEKVFKERYTKKLKIEILDKEITTLKERRSNPLLTKEQKDELTRVIKMKEEKKESLKIDLSDRSKINQVNEARDTLNKNRFYLESYEKDLRAKLLPMYQQRLRGQVKSNWLGEKSLKKDTFFREISKIRSELGLDDNLKRKKDKIKIKSTHLNAHGKYLLKTFSRALDATTSMPVKAVLTVSAIEFTNQFDAKDNKIAQIIGGSVEIAVSIATDVAKSVAVTPFLKMQNENVLEQVNSFKRDLSDQVKSLDGATEYLNDLLSKKSLTPKEEGDLLMQKALVAEAKAQVELSRFKLMKREAILNKEKASFQTSAFSSTTDKFKDVSQKIDQAGNYFGGIKLSGNDTLTEQVINGLQFIRENVSPNQYEEFLSLIGNQFNLETSFAEKSEAIKTRMIEIISQAEENSSKESKVK